MSKSTKIQAKILWYNEQKETGEAESSKGQKIKLFKKSFQSDKDLSSLNSGLSIECEIFNRRQDGLFAYNAKVLQ